GNVQLLRQLYVNWGEAFLSCNYHECLWHKEQQNKVSEEETKRYVRRIEELTLKVAETRKDFFGVVYRLPLLFSMSDDVKKKWESIIAHKSPAIKDFPKDLNNQQLKDALQKGKEELHKIVDEVLYQPTKGIYESLGKKFSY
ncbi:MAG: hypothetical protein ABIH42_03075, partial [Planctomycetota bacterium]